MESMVVVVDCATGQTTARDMTAEETAAHQQLQAAVQKAEQARRDDDAARDVTLAQVAAKVGVSVSDLKGALRLGPAGGKKSR